MLKKIVALCAALMFPWSVVNASDENCVPSREAGQANEVVYAEGSDYNRWLGAYHGGRYVEVGDASENPTACTALFVLEIKEEKPKAVEFKVYYWLDRWMNWGLTKPWRKKAVGTLNVETGVMTVDLGSGRTVEYTLENVDGSTFLQARFHGTLEMTAKLQKTTETAALAGN